MSIAVLTQVYDETRRLAIAGSAVASGDFRLKKLIAPLEQAGAKAPVFAKAAQAVRGVVDSTEKTSAQSLMELSTLVNAVLYTQGETGLAGDFSALETTDLCPQTPQATARTLKPLLEALTTKGSGRLEIIKEAHSRGAFRDLRLVQSALGALNDAYPEVAEFVAREVLPMYGNSILPQLKSAFTVDGNQSDSRRLALMHRLDPAGTREIVKQALESGSKELRIAAIECLGSEPEDLQFLLEQSSAKAKDLRAAALKALAALDSDDAVAVLQKALTGSDIALVTEPLQQNRNPKLLKFILNEAQQEVDNLFQLDDVKTIAKSFDRLNALLTSLINRKEKSIEPFLLKCFSRREELLQSKVENLGKEVIRLVAMLLADISPKGLQILVQAHPTLNADLLDIAFMAACVSLKPAEVYVEFSPYLIAAKDKKNKAKKAIVEKGEVIANAIADEGRWFRGYDWDKPAPDWDPRWLEVAVTTKDLNLVHELARPGSPAAIAFLLEDFEARFNKRQYLNDVVEVSWALVRCQYPGITELFIKVLTKFAGPKSTLSWGINSLARMIPDLPQSSAAKLEELLPKLHEQAMDALIQPIAALKNKA